MALHYGTINDVYREIISTQSFENNKKQKGIKRKKQFTTDGLGDSKPRPTVDKQT